MTRPDPRYDLLRFGLAQDLAQTTTGRLAAGLRRDAAQTLAALGWWASGKRLRGRMRLRALIGDRVKWRGDGPVLVAPGPRGDAPPDWPLRDGLAIEASGDILLVAAPVCRWPADAAARLTDFFAARPQCAAAVPDAVAFGLPGVGDVPVLSPAFDVDHWLALAPAAPALAIRRAAFDALGGLDASLPGAEFADLLLRLAGRDGEAAITTIDSVVVGWDARGADSALDETATLALLAARLELARRHAGPDADVALDAAGAARMTRRPKRWPAVTVIIPTRDRLDLLRRAVDGVLSATDYDDLELIVVDNASAEPATADYLARLRDDPRARVLRDEAPFNFSRLNNVAARLARGDVLLFLNNDVEVTSPRWLRAMAAEALRADVGAVGAKLLYPSGLVQHAGVVTALDGFAGHAHQFYPGDHRGYLHQIATRRRVHAVTAACMAVEKRKFDAVGGFDEAAFAVALNDVDLCFRLDERGWRSLYLPDACLVHHESATRANDRARAESARWKAEKAALAARWPQRMARDPFYPPALGRRMADYALPRVRRDKQS
ncbi:MAG: glycosyltransferase family 2 protein [Methylobacteriaceae bacterium]|nr:glycosyltransferase family 2 protein [Methylobacteriaceae bacterium]